MEHLIASKDLAVATRSLQGEVRYCSECSHIKVNRKYSDSGIPELNVPKKNFGTFDCFQRFLIFFPKNYLIMTFSIGFVILHRAKSKLIYRFCLLIEITQNSYFMITADLVFCVKFQDSNLTDFTKRKTIIKKNMKFLKLCLFETWLIVNLVNLLFQKSLFYREFLVIYIFQPDRCHHCSMCNDCVLKMDHHCPWVNNCVGFYNQKFFFLFLGYAFFYCMYVMLSTLKYFIDYWSHDAMNFSNGK